MRFEKPIHIHTHIRENSPDITLSRDSPDNPIIPGGPDIPASSDVFTGPEMFVFL